jgi:Tol biopolymer transport system component
MHIKRLLAREAKILMKRICRSIGLSVFFSSIFFITDGRLQKKDFSSLKGPFFGQTAPEKKAEVFLDGLISTLDQPEMCAAFTLDGKEFYYNDREEGQWSIFVTKLDNGRWTKPRPLPFTSGYTDRDFTMSPDGNRIYFGSNRPRKLGGPRQLTLDIFVTERLPSGEWSQPRVVGFPVSTEASENYPSVARNGNLYFFSKRDDGIGLYDIYVARFRDGRYQQAECLGRAVNSDKNDWDAYIAPGESYIIFSSQNRDDTIGKQDLYISFRGTDGSWTPAKNMGPCVNSPSDEICPSVSLDKKILFFTSRRRGKSDIYWIDAKIIEDLKPKELK